MSSPEKLSNINILTVAKIGALRKEGNAFPSKLSTRENFLAAEKRGKEIKWNRYFFPLFNSLHLSLFISQMI